MIEKGNLEIEKRENIVGGGFVVGKKFHRVTLGAGRQAPKGMKRE